LKSDLANRIESPVNLEKSLADLGNLSKYLFFVKNNSSAKSGELIIRATVFPKAKPTIGCSSLLSFLNVASANSVKG
jgi:hypothetical protein